MYEVVATILCTKDGAFPEVCASLLIVSCTFLCGDLCTNTFLQTTRLFFFFLETRNTCKWVGVYAMTTGLRINVCSGKGGDGGSRQQILISGESLWSRKGWISFVHSTDLHGKVQMVGIRCFCASDSKTGWSFLKAMLISDKSLSLLSFVAWNDKDSENNICKTSFRVACIFFLANLQASCSKAYIYWDWHMDCVDRVCDVHCQNVACVSEVEINQWSYNTNILRSRLQDRLLYVGFFTVTTFVVATFVDCDWPATKQLVFQDRSKTNDKSKLFVAPSATWICVPDIWKAPAGSPAKMDADKELSIESASEHGRSKT